MNTKRSTLIALLVVALILMAWPADAKTTASEIVMHASTAKDDVSVNRYALMTGWQTAGGDCTADNTSADKYTGKVDAEMDTNNTWSVTVLPIKHGGEWVDNVVAKRVVVCYVPPSAQAAAEVIKKHNTSTSITVNEPVVPGIIIIDDGGETVDDGGDVVVDDGGDQGGDDGGDVADDQSNNGNHYGNDEADHNQNDVNNQHNGENTAAEHHDEVKKNGK